MIFITVFKVTQVDRLAEWRFSMASIRFAYEAG